jgi:hypothetical protein
MAALLLTLDEQAGELEVQVDRLSCHLGLPAHARHANPSEAPDAPSIVLPGDFA